MIKAAGFRYIPKGAMKVADKKSDAVAYLYSTEINGKAFPAARVFFGKQTKPVLACYFTPFGDQTAEQQRAKRIAQFFDSRQQTAAFRAEQRAKWAAKAKEAAAKVEPGAYFYTSWGYDQTNIDWYRVEKLIGTTMALVTRVQTMDASKGDEGWMQGKSIPGETPVGKPFKVKLNATGFKADGHTAFPWDGKPKNWTAYA